MKVLVLFLCLTLALSRLRPEIPHAAPQNDRNQFKNELSSVIGHAEDSIGLSTINQALSSFSAVEPVIGEIINPPVQEFPLGTVQIISTSDEELGGKKKAPQHHNNHGGSNGLSTLTEALSLLSYLGSDEELGGKKKPQHHNNHGGSNGLSTLTEALSLLSYLGSDEELGGKKKPQHHNNHGGSNGLSTLTEALSLLSYLGSDEELGGKKNNHPKKMPKLQGESGGESTLSMALSILSAFGSDEELNKRQHISDPIIVEHHDPIISRISVSDPIIIAQPPISDPIIVESLGSSDDFLGKKNNNHHPKVQNTGSSTLSLALSILSAFGSDE